MFRDRMPITSNWVYLDHAAVAPLPKPSADAVREFADDYEANGSLNWPAWRKRIETLRGHFADLLSADADEIALIRSTTEGVGLVAEGIDWKPGDSVLVPESDFPSNRLPWQNLASKGVECRNVPTAGERLTVDDLEKQCDDSTRLVSVSFVGYASGYRTDLAAVCEWAKRRGLLVFVDGIQGLGVLPLDVSDLPIDFLAADGHKWMLGPEGAGVLYVRRERLSELRPLGVGWNSVVNAGSFHEKELTIKPEASRYEGGTYNMVGFAALLESMKLLRSETPDAITTRLRLLTDTLCESLERAGCTIASDRSDKHWSGIVSASHPEYEPQRMQATLRKAGITTNCRAGRLRLSPHVYQTEDEMHAVGKALGSM